MKNEYEGISSDHRNDLIFICLPGHITIASSQSITLTPAIRINYSQFHFIIYNFTLPFVMSVTYRRCRMTGFLMLALLFGYNYYTSRFIRASLSDPKLSQRKDLTCSQRHVELLNKNYLLSDGDFLSAESQCPQALWLHEILSLDMKQTNRTPTGISVGCNTGMDAMGTSRALSHNPIFSKAVWLSLMENSSKTDLIAVCRTDKAVDEGLHADVDDMTLNPQSLPKHIEYHCIEPVTTTFQALQESSEKLRLANHGFHIHRYVVSNSSGFVLFPKGSAGVENLGVSDCSEEIDETGSCENVTMLTLDSFVAKHVQSKNVIDALFIDTEGFDFRVLRKARATLERTRYLEFEYHTVWSNDETLKDAASYLEALDFVCYFAGKGNLLKVTHGCWTERYEIRRWSNIACVRTSEASWVEIMENYFNKTLSLLTIDERKKEQGVESSSKNITN
jgi:FkbM family methyltransferase